MRMLRRLVSVFGLVLFTAFAMIFVLACPLNVSFAEQSTQSLENFTRAVSNMTSKFSDEQVVLDDEEYFVDNGKVFVSKAAAEKYNLTEAEPSAREVGNFQSNTEIAQNFIPNDFCAVENLKEENGQVVVDTLVNRLIVSSPSKVNDFGAVAVAEYDDWHVFQYTSHQQAQYAYDQLSNMNINVSFDFVVRANDNFDGPVETKALIGSHNSWADEYVGYDLFTQTTLTMHEKSALPEVVVAVLDSGIYENHQLFKNRVLKDEAKAFFVDEWDSLYEYQDLNGHGTHVSGTIAEFTQENVKILPLKVLDHAGEGYGVYIINALEYLIQLKNPENGSGLNIKVANMSLGIDVSNVSKGYPALALAVEKAYNNGIASVVAAGNENRDAHYSAPAYVPEAFTVSALMQSTNQLGVRTVKFDSVHSHSNFGTCIDFSAPGAIISSAAIPSYYDWERPNGYVSMSGTSMATPHVSAAVALVYSNPYYANYTLSQVYDLLAENAVDLGDIGTDKLYGNGCINLKNIGVEFDVNEISFSPQETSGQGEVDVQLHYAGDADVEIYYLFGAAETVNAENGNKYSGAIHISSSTKTDSTETSSIKISAMAYYKNFENKTLQVSKLSSKNYYFNDFDVLENYDFQLVSTGYEISKYTGTDLTTLHVPKDYKGQNVVGIGAYAFSDAKVETLYLPKTITYFDNSAFSGNEFLQKIYCESNSVEVRDYAFNNCTNLTDFEVLNISHVSAYAFSNCKKLEKLNLLKADEIGENALQGVDIKEIYLAENIKIFEQNEVKVGKVFGYANSTVNDAKEFSDKFDGDFQDLTLKITSDLNYSIIVKKGETANFGLAFVGYDVKFFVYLNGENYVGSDLTSQVLGSYTGQYLSIKISNLSQNNKCKIILKDIYGNKVESREMEIDVVSDSTNTFAISQSGENFSVTIKDAKNGEEVSDSQNFYKSSKYEITILPEDGFLLKSVVVRANSKIMQPEISSEFGALYRLENIEDDISIEVETEQQQNLTVEFQTGGLGEIYVEEVLVNGSVQVENGESVKFKIVPKTGYEIRHVILNDVRIDDGEKNEFEILDIRKNMFVVVLFSEVRFKVVVSNGKGGNLSTNGDIEGDFKFGEVREYHITPSDGYSVDSVTINGKAVDVVDGKFVLEGFDEDCNIVVFFKKNVSIFAEGSIALAYLFIFSAIMFVFILAKVILTLVRKKKKNVDLAVK